MEIRVVNYIYIKSVGERIPTQGFFEIEYTSLGKILLAREVLLGEKNEHILEELKQALSKPSLKAEDYIDNYDPIIILEFDNEDLE